MIDDLLLQEICSLREKIKIAVKILKFYEPAFEESDFLHRLGSIDYQMYIDEVVNSKEN